MRQKNCFLRVITTLLFHVPTMQCFIPQRRFSSPKIFKKHSAAISGFGKEFVKTGEFEEKYHGYLLNAFREREKGDYDVFLFQGKEDAEEVLKNAEEFISAVENFLLKLGYERKGSCG